MGKMMLRSLQTYLWFKPAMPIIWTFVGVRPTDLSIVI